MVKIKCNILFLSLFLFSFSPPNIELGSEQTMQLYRQCLVNADKSLINKIASTDFRAGVYQQPISKDMFVSFLRLMQMPDSLYWDDLQQAGDESFRMVHYVFADKKTSSRVYFAPDGKLLFSDWIDQQGLGLSRKKASTFVASVPFEYEGGKIIITAKLNDSDKPLRMLFDTGADGMALTKSLQEVCGVQITNEQSANVPGGQVQVSKSDNNTLVLDSLSIPRQSLVLFEHIAKGIDGIIGGANLFRNYITAMDFENKQINLYSLGDFNAPDGYHASNMAYAGGVPTVPFHIYKDEHHFESEFIFDTGAGYSAILFGSGMKRLESDSISKFVTPQYYSYNQSLGGRTKISIGQTDSIAFAGISFSNANLAMEPYSEKNHARHHVLGSIGIKSLSRFDWIVDLVSYQIYTKENSFSELPMDFVFQGWLLGYEGNNLKVLLPVSQERMESLQVGDEILSFGKCNPSAMTADKLNKELQKKKINLQIKKQTGVIKLTVEGESE